MRARRWLPIAAVLAGCAAPSSPDARSRCPIRVRSGSSWWATPAAGSSPRTGSSRPATTPRSGRSRAVAGRGGGCAPRIWSSTSATITIVRTRVRMATADARAVRGATAGMRGRPISSPLRQDCSLPRRGSSCAATTNRAAAPGRAGGDSSIRVRCHPGQDCNTAADDARWATTANRMPCRSGSAANADTQFIVFDSSNGAQNAIPRRRIELGGLSPSSPVFRAFEHSAH